MNLQLIIFLNFLTTFVAVTSLEGYAGDLERQFRTGEFQRQFGTGNFQGNFHSSEGLQLGYLNEGELGYVSGFPGILSILGHKSVGSCKSWCLTSSNKYFCCTRPMKATVRMKPGKCPPSKFFCPTVTSPSSNSCSDDYTCGGGSKCCYDNCLKHKTCMKANYWFFN